jgi:hypothetical protein
VRLSLQPEEPEERELGDFESGRIVSRPWSASDQGTRGFS